VDGTFCTSAVATPLSRSAFTLSLRYLIFFSPDQFVFADSVCLSTFSFLHSLVIRWCGDDAMRLADLHCLDDPDRDPAADDLMMMFSTAFLVVNPVITAEEWSWAPGNENDPMH